jgi:SAM-dependent methyltransferase
MVNVKTELLSNPGLYHHLRQILTGGMPFGRWVELYGLDDPTERVADIGCGPSDILRYVRPGSGPNFYVGVDLSERYLGVAEKRARRLGVESKFIRMDLDHLATDAALQRELIETLEKHRITRVLLLGVLHHISDDAGRTTLNLAHDVATVDSVVTSDVVYVPDGTLNNLLCDWDRGEFVRDEQGYDDLVRSSSWPNHRKAFTHPGFSFIRYLHYLLSRRTELVPEPGRAEATTSVAGPD